MEFIVSVVAVYVIFRILDAVFAPRRPMKIREGDFIKEIDGQYYIVRDVEDNSTVENEVEAPPHQRKPTLKVVK